MKKLGLRILVVMLVLGATCIFSKVQVGEEVSEGIETVRQEIEDPTDAIDSVCEDSPIADFSVTPTIICLGETVNLTDLSSNSPTSWSWTFECGTPLTSTAQNPTVSFNALGRCNITLTITNEFGSDTITKTITVVECCRGDCTYCSSLGNSQQYEWIARVEVGGIDNSSGPSQYTEFTDFIGTAATGGNVSVRLTPGYENPKEKYTENWKIWIDYNRDCFFDPDTEEVFSASGSSVVSGSFTVPEDACFGYTRIRVSMKFDGWSIPCEEFPWGEVEDYTLRIFKKWEGGDVGNREVFQSRSYSGNRRALPFTMPENGFIQSITMYHDGGSGSMILGLYDGSGSPQNRLGVTAATAVSVGAGWQTINLTSSAFVTGGTTIWLAWVYENNPGIAYESGSPGRFQSTGQWAGGMPDPFGSGSQSNYIYSIYATYTYY